MSIVERVKQGPYDETAELRAALRRAQRQVARYKARRDELAAVTVDACTEAVLAHGALAPVASPSRDARRKGAEVALWHLTDWQGAKRTLSYSSEVMRARVARYCDRAERITGIQRADHPVRDAMILLGGDMIEGLFNFPTQPFEIDASLFEQYVSVAMLLAETVRRALALYERVTVVAEWGNHGRLGSKRSAVPRSDNADRMTYELARNILSGETRLTWADCPEDIQHVEIGAYRAILLHGDEIGRNGYASPMTIVQHVARWQSGAHRWEFRDAYVGHYHTHNEWALPNGFGSVYQTGSTESDNRYAGVHMASSAVPSQRLHFVDPARGRVTAAYKVWLDD
ncbi:MAG TPA: hypothetical protein VN088_14750 [Nocardioides sp.]|nr:hypothetical protein [Nocardioides sp.]